jgi:hypothetical protein
VSEVAPVGFADAAGAADRLTGQEIVEGRVRLQIKERIGTGLAGAVWYEGVLHAGRFTPPVRVDVVVSPWSAGRSEIGLRPLSRIGRPESFRAGLFFSAAWAVLPRLVAALSSAAPVRVPASEGLRVAA